MGEGMGVNEMKIHAQWAAANWKKKESKKQNEVQACTYASCIVPTLFHNQNQDYTVY